MESKAMPDSQTPQQTRVTVVLAAYNEEAWIERSLTSILRQHTCGTLAGEFALEVLVVDGMSSDGTRAMVERCARGDSRVRLIDNPRRRAPFAFNLGLQHAQGEYVCILGAHSVYREDYLAVCLDELLRHQAAGCGGRVRTVAANRTLGARLAAWVMAHPFGSSRKSFRTQREGPVDTVNYAVFRRDLALQAGGYDEYLLRNQDNDLNQKLRTLGYPLWCTWKTECQYFPKATVRELLRYGYGNGFWNALSLAKNPEAMGIRHFVPFLFLMALELSAVLGLGCVLLLAVPASRALLPFTFLLALHLVAGAAAGLQLALRERSPGALLLPSVFLGFHLAYGFGTLRGFLKQPPRTRLPNAGPRRDSVPQGD